MRLRLVVVVCNLLFFMYIDTATAEQSSAPHAAKGLVIKESKRLLRGKDWKSMTLEEINNSGLGKAYLADLQRRIKRAWFPPKDQNKKPILTETIIVKFIIKQNGHISNAEVAKESSLKKANEAALKAVEGAAPFRPLIPSVRELADEVQVEFTFSRDTFKHGGGHSAVSMNARQRS